MKLPRQLTKRQIVTILNSRAFGAAMKIAQLAKTVYDPDPWKNREARQAYLDCLLILQRFGIIDDFSVVEGTVNKTMEAADETPKTTD